MAKACAFAAASRGHIMSESNPPCRRFPACPRPSKRSPSRSSAWRKARRLRIPGREFGLIVDEPAEFRFFCSAVRKNDAARRLIEDFGDDLEELSPVEVKLTSDRPGADLVPVSFETVITETGMLQLWCVARDGRRWKLEFNVRETRRPAIAGLHESWHRPRDHQLRPRLDRSGARRRIPVFRPFTFSKFRSSSRPIVLNRAAPCRRFFFSKKDNPSALTRASRERSCRRAWCTARNPGSRMPMSIARRKSCRGTRAKADAFCRPSKSPSAFSPPCSRSVGQVRPFRSARRAGCRPHGSGIVRRRSPRAYREWRPATPVCPV